MHKNLRKHQGMPLLWRPTLRWEDIVNVDCRSCEMKWSVVGLCEHNNETVGFIKAGNLMGCVNYFTSN
jgi:hypothetical protein